VTTIVAVAVVAVFAIVVVASASANMLADELHDGLEVKAIPCIMARPVTSVTA